MNSYAVSVWIMHNTKDHPPLYKINLLHICRPEEVIEAEASISFLKTQFSKSDLSSNQQPEVLILDRACLAKGESVIHFDFDPDSVKYVDNLKGMCIMLVALKEDDSTEFYYPAVACPHEDFANWNVMMVLLEFGISPSKVDDYHTLAEQMIDHMSTAYDAPTIAIADLLVNNKEYHIGIVSTSEPDTLQIFQPLV